MFLFYFFSDVVVVVKNVRILWYARYSHIFNKNSSVFAFEVDKYLPNCGLNDSVKLTKF